MQWDFDILMLMSIALDIKRLICLIDNYLVQAISETQNTWRLGKVQKNTMSMN
jgi:hypothetical protein